MRCGGARQDGFWMPRECRQLGLGWVKGCQYRVGVEVMQLKFLKARQGGAEEGREGIGNVRTSEKGWGGSKSDLCRVGNGLVELSRDRAARVEQPAGVGEAG